MHLHIRDAGVADRSAVRAVTMRAYGEYATTMQPSAWAALLGAVESALIAAGRAHRIVVEREGAIVGSVMLFPPAADAYSGATARGAHPELRLLAVDPLARGHGVARLLVEECVHRARADGAEAIGLHTSASMRGAIRLYAGMGFVRDPARDFQPDGAELVEGYLRRL